MIMIKLIKGGLIMKDGYNVLMLDLALVLLVY